MTELYAENLENKPKRLQPRAFVESISNLPLQNEFLPEFDVHVCEIVSSLSLSKSDQPTFEDALRRLKIRSRSCPNCGLPYRLKLIFFGYCITHQWTIWASLDRGTPLKILPRSLLEAPQFVISVDFESAMYGALSFKEFRIDRLDLMETAGSREYNLPRWSDLEVMSAVELQKIRPDGNRSRSISLERMLSTHDLFGGVRSIPRNVLDKINVRTTNFWEVRRIVTGGAVKLFEASPVNITPPEENHETQPARGCPPKIDAVRDGFFHWLIMMENKRLPGLTTAKTQISKLLTLLKDQNYVEKSAGPKTIKKHLEALKYIKKNEHKTVAYEWIPKAWAAPLEAWKKGKEIPYHLFDSIEM